MSLNNTTLILPYSNSSWNITNSTNYNINNLTIDYISKINFLLISTDKCTSNYSKAYCYYSSFLVLCGYLCNMSVIPFVFYRIMQLKTKFRNQYNLTLLWLCSILLMFLIDLIEYIAIGNGKVYSSGIIFIQCISIVLCISTIVQYARYHSLGGPAYYRAIVVICFSTCLFILILIARIWSQKNLAKFNFNIDQLSPVDFHLTNTYSFFYYFIYAMFASVQVYENVMNDFARCLTNMSYALWFVGSFMLGFYTDLLPKRPVYDYVHYRNYFQMSTLIIIILQELNYKRLKRNQNMESKTQVNIISMKEMNSSKREHRPSFLQLGSKYQGLDYVDKVFETTTEQRIVTDDDEVTYFDVEQFGTNGKHSIEEKKSDDNEFVSAQSKSKFEKLYQKYKAFLIAMFVLFLIANLIYSIVILFRHTTFSHFKLLTLLIHPFTIAFAMTFRSYSYKCYPN